MKIDNIRGLIFANVAVIGLALFSVLSIGNVQLLYPYDDMVTADRTPSFEWSGWPAGYTVLIDDDKEFLTPFTFETTGNVLSIEKDIDFGDYWWKVTGDGFETEPKKFTIVSAVDLSRPEISVIKNSGNTALLVHGSGITGALTLGVNETLNISGEEYVRAEQA